jgi:hypothetical protein
MKPKLLPLLVLFTAVILAACGKNNPADSPTAEDDAAINNVLLVSGYTDTTGFVNDNTSTPYASPGLVGGAKADTFPMTVRWARRIDRVTRTVDISYDSSNAVALAHVTLDFYGHIYVDNTDDGLLNPNADPLHDRGHRLVRLRKVNNRWRIWGVTPLEIATVNPPYNVLIDRVVVSGCDNGPIEILPSEMSSARLRENLPVFNPGDTAVVTVYCRTDGGDSTWAFLHRWLYRLPRHHIRWPLFRENATTFVRSWEIQGDSIPAFMLPAVRHASVDVLAWNTLFGDSTASYAARIWCQPYIVTQDSLPE